MTYTYAFIISHMHGGAGPLQEYLNRQSGTCIRGANAGALFSLSRMAANLQASQRFADTAAASGSPWHGADRMQIEEFIAQTVSGFVHHVLTPPTGTRLTGFSETRHLMPEPQLFEYLDFLRTYFPGALLIFQTRDPDDLPADGNPDISAIRRAQASFRSYAEQHPQSCISLQHEEWAGNPDRLQPLLAKLGLTADTPPEQAPAWNGPPPGTVENGVMVGKDGWLFLWSGSNDVHRYYTDSGYFTDRDAQDWADLLNTRRTRIAALGATYRHLTVPDKISVYRDHLPRSLPHPDRHPVRQIAALVDAHFNLDILNDLRRGTAAQPIFYKTDTHWNHEGCLIAYQRLCASLDVTPQVFPTHSRPAREMVLDLGNKFQPPIQENARFLPVLRHARRVGDNEMVRYNEAEGFAKGTPRFVGCHIRTLNESPTARPETVVLFGDSFSEFRPHLLTAMLAETYREVHFVWSTSLDYDFIARIRPQIVITEIAERFVKKLPIDDFHVPMDEP
ncbi:alginate O-acetyltransferase AlgX-related protein [Paracoccus laeviglucosivorans]|uniref:SGNH hydrolase-like domain-containing protein, acetyltransferase AlgX n=1 Tax=Paracoccus laeviglucosivorans TaxID=1197861 RepID=A0A521CVJ1_9RHOB|nr:hypothetical protein [Paracoccus laeviglucosivorans]SMO63474.1 SGNH hydrolase-like domain-containing protein, acetyltransferase AlgX [Paracoccus laeviglucosivorans]